MLIRCCDCRMYKDGDCEHNDTHEGIANCNTPFLKEPLCYRYSLADKLHRAVLERLLAPKNMVKGEFSKKTGRLVHEGVMGEFQELSDAEQDYSGEIGDRNESARRIIEEAGDVGAYLAAIIDAVSGDG